VNAVIGDGAVMGKVGMNAVIGDGAVIGQVGMNADPTGMVSYGRYERFL
jgi:UDP-3-O-[3-hydroxymyristoyl] glucosamine N-acyltransferase